MDQGVFATANFVLNILLGRWLSLADYGSFAVGYTTFLFLSTFHSAFLNEPMLVFGSGKYKHQWEIYFRTLLDAHCRIGMIIGILFLLTAGLLYGFTGSLLCQPFFGLAIASPLILFQWLMRRACYIQLRPHLAAVAGLGYMTFVIAGALAIHHVRWLNPFTTLLVMAAASLLSGLWIVYRLGVFPSRGKNPGRLPAALVDHWRYGRWAAGTTLLAWVPGNVFLMLLPIWWGLEAAAAYKALLNLLLPMMHITTALSAVLLPQLVIRRGAADVRPIVVRITLTLALGASVYWLALGLFGDPILRGLYGFNYVDYAPLLWLAGVIPMVGVVVSVGGVVLQSLEQPKKVFQANLGAAGTIFSLGWLIVFFHGVYGAMAGWLIAHVVTAAMTICFLRKKTTATPVSTE